MRILIAAFILLVPSMVSAKVDLEADKRETQQLNRNAGAAAAKRDRAMIQYNSHEQSGYTAARQRYEQQMADWRRRVQLCEQGYYSYCQ